MTLIFILVVGKLTAWLSHFYASTTSILKLFVQILPTNKTSNGVNSVCVLCVCVCAYVCVCACACAHTRMCVCACMRACVYVCVLGV